MKKTFKGQFPLIIASFLLILWSIMRIRVLFENSLSGFKIFINILFIIVALILAFRAFILYIDYIYIDEEKLCITSLFSSKKVLLKDIKETFIKNNIIHIKTKKGIPFTMDINAFPKKNRDEIKNTIVSLKRKIK